MLILATVPNPTPACEQNIQVNSLLINNLKETKHHVSSRDNQKTNRDDIFFFFFWLSDKRDTMNVIDQKVLYIKILYININ